MSSKNTNKKQGTKQAQTRKSKAPEKKNKGKQQKKRVAKQRRAKPLGTFVSSLQLAPSKTSVTVQSVLNPRAIQILILSLFSGQLNSGILESPEVSSGTIGRIFNGVKFLGDGLWDEIHGRPALESRFSCVNDAIAALKPKDIPTMGVGSVSYAWASDSDNPDTVPEFSVYSTPWMDWKMTYINQDTETYDSPAREYVPGDVNPSDYSEYLGLFQDYANQKGHPLTVVPTGTSSRFDSDASAFSRVYSYNGTNVTGSGGYYNEAENETKIFSPNLAGFSTYTTPDKRVPRYLQTTSLGPEKLLGLPLTSVFDGPRDFCNKIPIVVKPINLYTTVYKMAAWMVLLAQQGLTEGIEFETMPLTFQDFTIIVMQALKATVFRDQHLVQFSSPLDYTQQSNNVIPVGIMGHTYGAQNMGNILGPVLGTENLAACQAVSFELPETTSKVVYFPVLSYAEEDIQPIFQVIRKEGEPPIPLFTSAKQSEQQKIRLSDGKISPGDTYVNLNGTYYQNCGSVWNSYVNKYVNLSTEIGFIGNMAPARGLHILATTKHINNPVREKKELATGARYMTPPFSTNIANSENAVALEQQKKVPLVKQDSKVTIKAKEHFQAPMAGGPATLEQLSVDYFTSSYPLSKEMLQFLSILTTPEFRTSEENNIEDYLNCDMWRTITREPCLTMQTKTGPTYMNEVWLFAALCTKGWAGSNSNYYELIIRVLQSSPEERKEGGVLASLIGGFAKTLFPNASGVIDTIASVVPI